MRWKCRSKLHLPWSCTKRWFKASIRRSSSKSKSSRHWIRSWRSPSRNRLILVNLLLAISTRSTNIYEQMLQSQSRFRCTINLNSSIRNQLSHRFSKRSDYRSKITWVRCIHSHQLNSSKHRILCQQAGHCILSSPNPSSANSSSKRSNNNLSSNRKKFVSSNS